MRLEPYEGKPSSTVLRGGSGSNVTSLPDTPPTGGNPQETYHERPSSLFLDAGRVESRPDRTHANPAPLLGEIRRSEPPGCGTHPRAAVRDAGSRAGARAGTGSV